MICFPSEDIIHEVLEVSEHALVEYGSLLRVLREEDRSSTLMLIL